MTTGSRGVSSVDGVVAAAHPLAASAGAKILSQGGNAFDAAAACAAALGVVEPYMSGPAGTGVATCYVADEQRVRTLDFVPRVPEGLPNGDLRALVRDGGAVTVATPGCLGGWDALVARYGRLSLAEVLQPAISLATRGFALTEFAAAEVATTFGEMTGPSAIDRPALEALYVPEAHPVAAGQVLQQPALAELLTAVANGGAGAFYRGPIGQRIVEVIGRNGGWVAEQDLADFAPQWSDPLTADYRDVTAASLAPPSEAFQFLLTLRILDGVELRHHRRNGVEHLDTVFRAARLAAIERVARFDPSLEELADLLGDDHVGELRERLRSSEVIEGPTERGSIWPGEPAATTPEQHTTSLSVADDQGNVVCITQSLGSVFGSRIVVDDLGLCLNNFLKWGAVDPESPAALRPGGPLPRPMAPSILLRNGKPVLSVGSPGSYGIPQHQAQVVVQHVDFGLPIQQAIEEPRARLTDGTAVLIEDRVDSGVVAALGERGHTVTTGPAYTRKVGGVQAIAIDQQRGVMHGACDPRRDGYVASG